MNHNGSTIGYLTGIYNETTLTDGTIGDDVEDLEGIYNKVVLTAGTISDDMVGITSILNLNGGTVTDNVFGHYIDVNIDSAMTSVGGDAYGEYIQVDDDQGVTGTVYMLYLKELTGVDYGIYQDGTAGNSFGGNITISTTSNWIGLGSSAGRMVFDSALTPDSLYFMSCNLGVGAQGTLGKLHVVNDDTAANLDAVYIDNNDPDSHALNIQGNTSQDGVLKIKERAAAVADTAAYGQLWVKTATPCELWFTDDAGTDTQIVPLLPAFLARPTSNQSNIATGSDVTIVFGTEVFDQGGNFASNTFTAPVDGKYHLDAVLYLTDVDKDAVYYLMKIITSNRSYSSFVQSYRIFSDDVTHTMSISILADMDAADTAYVTLFQAAGAAQTDATTSGTYFSGYLVV